MDFAGPENAASEQRARDEQEELSRRGMQLLTGGLTDQGDAFLIGVCAAALVAMLYPSLGGWSMLAFPVVFIVAVAVRGRLRRR